MATAENAKLEYEAGQQAISMTMLTDSGDATQFESSFSLWSGKSGYAPVIRPNGLLTGGVVVPSTGNNQIDVAALSAQLNGFVLVVPASAPVTVPRPTTNVAKISSITVTHNGSVAVVEGLEGSTASYAELRGAEGGPPFIPADSIEIAQVRVAESADAVILPSQIFSVVGAHVEMAHYPLFTVHHDAGSVVFLAALPRIHTGSTTKKVCASYAAPLFAEISLASDFKPPETSHSVSSTQIYGTTLGSTSQTLGQGGFTAYLEDGVSDGLILQKNELLWFRFYPDRYKTAHLLTQGKLGIGRTFPAGDNIQAACTISATAEAMEVV